MVFVNLFSLMYVVYNRKLYSGRGSVMMQRRSVDLMRELSKRWIKVARRRRMSVIEQQVARKSFCPKCSHPAK